MGKETKRYLFIIEIISISKKTNAWYDAQQLNRYFAFYDAINGTYEIASSALGHRVYASDCREICNYNEVTPTLARNVLIKLGKMGVNAFDVFNGYEGDVFGDTLLRTIDKRYVQVNPQIPVDDNLCNNDTCVSGAAFHIKDDPINHPDHYTKHPSGIECIQITEHMNFCVGNAVKYLWRADLKGKVVEDLKKAKWYIEREIKRREDECKIQK